MTLPIPMSPTEKFNIEYKSFCHESQHSAAAGLLGLYAYKNILDTESLIWVALAILNLGTVCALATTISPIYTIILSASFLGLLAFTINKIYQRYSYRTNARILEPVYMKVIDGNFTSAYEQLNDQLSSIFSIRDAKKRLLNFNLFSENTPFLDPRNGLNDMGMRVFYWQLSTLNAIEKTQGVDLPTFRRYSDELWKVSDWTGVRCSDRANKLLDISKEITERIPAPKASNSDCRPIL